MKLKGGFVLVELLVVLSLVSIAGTGLYASFIQTLKAKERVSDNFSKSDPYRLLFMRLEKDLRRAVILRDYPFEGRAHFIGFPTKMEDNLYWVEYELSQGSFQRKVRLLSARLEKHKPTKKKLLETANGIQFKFAYGDETSPIEYKSFWVDDPYKGLPRAVRFDIENPEGKSMIKMISIPQGVLGQARHIR